MWQVILVNLCPCAKGTVIMTGSDVFKLIAVMTSASLILVTLCISVTVRGISFVLSGIPATVAC